jgi:hypothetical protein
MTKPERLQLFRQAMSQVHAGDNCVLGGDLMAAAGWYAAASRNLMRVAKSQSKNDARAALLMAKRERRVAC